MNVADLEDQEAKPGAKWTQNQVRMHNKWYCDLLLYIGGK